MSFRFPYQARIMAQLTVNGVTHDPVELHRTQRSLSEQEWKFWTAGFDEKWDVWVETQTRASWLLGGGRSIQVTHGKGRERLILNSKENQALEESGLVVSFKLTP